MYFPEYGLVFLHIPKTSGKSMYWFLTGEHEPRAPHRSSLEIKKHLLDNTLEAMCFAVVRDPVDRLLSMYRYFSGGGTGRKNAIAVQKHLKKYSVNEFLSHPYKVMMEGSPLVRKGLTVQLTSQTEWVSGPGGGKITDFLVAMEDLPEFIPRFKRKHRIPREYPHINAARGRSVSISRETDEQIRPEWIQDDNLHRQALQDKHWKDFT